MCRKTQSAPETQKVADLSSKQIEPTSPFTYVESDCFGPFVFKDNKKEFKKYGVIFTCMASRAIHIELVEDLSTNAFTNALRCFIAIRGPIRQLHTEGN